MGDDAVFADFADGRLVGFFEHRQIAVEERTEIVVTGERGRAHPQRFVVQRGQLFWILFLDNCLGALDLLGRLGLEHGRAPRIKIVRVFDMDRLGYKCWGRGEKRIPVHVFEEWVLLNLVKAMAAKALLRVQGQQALHKITCLGRDLDDVCMPVDAS